MLKDSVIDWLGSLTFSWPESGSIRKGRDSQDAVLELSHQPSCTSSAIQHSTTTGDASENLSSPEVSNLAY